MFSFLPDTSSHNRSSFLFGCLLFRRCSLSFRNLLACHTVSRVCHCQSHSNEQSASIVYRILQKSGCSLGCESGVFQTDIVEKNGTVLNNTSAPPQTIHPSVHLSIYLVFFRRDVATNCRQEWWQTRDSHFPRISSCLNMPKLKLDDGNSAIHLYRCLIYVSIYLYLDVCRSGISFFCSLFRPRSKH